MPFDFSRPEETPLASIRPPEALRSTPEPYSRTVATPDEMFQGMAREQPFTAFAEEHVNVLGRSMSMSELRRFEGGDELIRLTQAQKEGRRGFLEAYTDVGIGDLPIIGDISGAVIPLRQMRKVAHTFQALEEGRHDDVSEQDLVYAQLYWTDQERRMAMDWRGKSGEILRAMPGHMADMRIYSWLAFGGDPAKGAAFKGLFGMAKAGLAAAGVAAPKGALAGPKGAAAAAIAAFVPGVIKAGATKVATSKATGAMKSYLRHLGGSKYWGGIAKGALGGLRDGTARMALDTPVDALLNMTRGLDPFTSRMAEERLIGSVMAGEGMDIAKAQRYALGDEWIEYVLNSSGQMFTAALFPGHNQGTLLHNTIESVWGKEAIGKLKTRMAAGQLTAATARTTREKLAAGGGVWAFGRAVLKGGDFEAVGNELKRWGYDGWIQQILEERYGAFLRGLFGVHGDEAGLKNAIRNTGYATMDDFITEILCYGVPGLATMATVKGHFALANVTQSDFEHDTKNAYEGTRPDGNNLRFVELDTETGTITDSAGAEVPRVSHADTIDSFVRLAEMAELQPQGLLPKITHGLLDVVTSLTQLKFSRSSFSNLNAMFESMGMDIFTSNYTQMRNQFQQTAEADGVEPGLARQQAELRARNFISEQLNVLRRTFAVQESMINETLAKQGLERGDMTAAQIAEHLDAEVRSPEGILDYYDLGNNRIWVRRGDNSPMAAEMAAIDGVMRDVLMQDPRLHEGLYTIGDAPADAEGNNYARHHVSPYGLPKIADIESGEFDLLINDPKAAFTPLGQRLASSMRIDLGQDGGPARFRKRLQKMRQYKDSGLLGSLTSNPKTEGVVQVRKMGEQWVATSVNDHAQRAFPRQLRASTLQELKTMLTERGYDHESTETPDIFFVLPSMLRSKNPAHLAEAFQKYGFDQRQGETDTQYQERAQRFVEDHGARKHGDNFWYMTVSALNSDNAIAFTTTASEFALAQDAIEQALKQSQKAINPNVEYQNPKPVRDFIGNVHQYVDSEMPDGDYRNHLLRFFSDSNSVEPAAQTFALSTLGHINYFTDKAWLPLYMAYREALAPMLSTIEGYQAYANEMARRTGLIDAQGNIDMAQLELLMDSALTPEQLQKISEILKRGLETGETQAPLTEPIPELGRQQKELARTPAPIVTATPRAQRKREAQKKIKADADAAEQTPATTDKGVVRITAAQTQGKEQGFLDMMQKSKAGVEVKPVSKATPVDARAEYEALSEADKKLYASMTPELVASYEMDRLGVLTDSQAAIVERAQAQPALDLTGLEAQARTEAEQMITRLSERAEHNTSTIPLLGMSAIQELAESRYGVPLKPEQLVTEALRRHAPTLLKLKDSPGDARRRRLSELKTRVETAEAVPEVETDVPEGRVLSAAETANLLDLDTKVPETESEGNKPTTAALYEAMIEAPERIVGLWELMRHVMPVEVASIEGLKAKLIDADPRLTSKAVDVILNEAERRLTDTEYVRRHGDDLRSEIMEGDPITETNEVLEATGTGQQEIFNDNYRNERLFNQGSVAMFAEMAKIIGVDPRLAKVDLLHSFRRSPMFKTLTTAELGTDAVSKHWLYNEATFKAWTEHEFESPDDQLAASILATMGYKDALQVALVMQNATLRKHVEGFHRIEIDSEGGATPSRMSLKEKTDNIGTKFMLDVQRKARAKLATTGEAAALWQLMKSQVFGDTNEGNSADPQGFAVSNFIDFLKKLTGTEADWGWLTEAEMARAQDRGVDNVVGFAKDIYFAMRTHKRALDANTLTPEGARKLATSMFMQKVTREGETIPAHFAQFLAEFDRFTPLLSVAKPRTGARVSGFDQRNVFDVALEGEAGVEVVRLDGDVQLMVETDGADENASESVIDRVAYNDADMTVSMQVDAMTGVFENPHIDKDGNAQVMFIPPQGAKTSIYGIMMPATVVEGAKTFAEAHALMFNHIMPKVMGDTELTPQKMQKRTHTISTGGVPMLVGIEGGVQQSEFKLLVLPGEAFDGAVYARNPVGREVMTSYLRPDGHNLKAHVQGRVGAGDLTLVKGNITTADRQTGGLGDVVTRNAHGFDFVTDEGAAKIFNKGGRKLSINITNDAGDVVATVEGVEVTLTPDMFYETTKLEHVASPELRGVPKPLSSDITPNSYPVEAEVRQRMASNIVEHGLPSELVNLRDLNYVEALEKHGINPKSPRYRMLMDVARANAVQRLFKAKGDATLSTLLPSGGFVVKGKDGKALRNSDGSVKVEWPYGEDKYVSSYGKSSDGRTVPGMLRVNAGRPGTKGLRYGMYVDADVTAQGLRELLRQYQVNPHAENYSRLLRMFRYSHGARPKVNEGLEFYDLFDTKGKLLDHHFVNASEAPDGSGRVYVPGTLMIDNRTPGGAMHAHRLARVSEPVAWRKNVNTGNLEPGAENFVIAHPAIAHAAGFDFDGDQGTQLWSLKANMGQHPQYPEGPMPQDLESLKPWLEQHQRASNSRVMETMIEAMDTMPLEQLLPEINKEVFDDVLVPHPLEPGKKVSVAEARDIVPTTSMADLETRIMMQEQAQRSITARGPAVSQMTSMRTVEAHGARLNYGRMEFRNGLEKPLILDTEAQSQSARAQGLEIIHKVESDIVNMIIDELGAPRAGALHFTKPMLGIYMAMARGAGVTDLASLQAFTQQYVDWANGSSIVRAYETIMEHSPYTPDFRIEQMLLQTPKLTDADKVEVGNLMALKKVAREVSSIAALEDLARKYPSSTSEFIKYRVSLDRLARNSYKNILTMGVAQAPAFKGAAAVLEAYGESVYTPDSLLRTRGAADILHEMSKVGDTMRPVSEYQHKQLETMLANAAELEVLARMAPEGLLGEIMGKFIAGGGFKKEDGGTPLSTWGALNTGSLAPYALQARMRKTNLHQLRALTHVMDSAWRKVADGTVESPFLQILQREHRSSARLGRGRKGTMVQRFSSLLGSADTDSESLSRIHRSWDNIANEFREGLGQDYLGVYMGTDTKGRRQIVRVPVEALAPIFAMVTTMQYGALSRSAVGGNPYVMFSPGFQKQLSDQTVNFIDKVYARQGAVAELGDGVMLRSKGRAIVADSYAPAAMTANLQSQYAVRSKFDKAATAFLAQESAAVTQKQLEADILGVDVPVVAAVEAPVEAPVEADVADPRLDRPFMMWDMSLLTIALGTRKQPMITSAAMQKAVTASRKLGHEPTVAEFAELAGMTEGQRQALAEAEAQAAGFKAPVEAPVEAAVETPAPIQVPEAQEFFRTLPDGERQRLITEWQALPTESRTFEALEQIKFMMERKLDTATETEARNKLENDVDVVAKAMYDIAPSELLWYPVSDLVNAIPSDVMQETVSQHIAPEVQERTYTTPKLAREAAVAAILQSDLAPELKASLETALLNAAPRGWDTAAPIAPAAPTAALDPELDNVPEERLFERVSSKAELVNRLKHRNAQVLSDGSAKDYARARRVLDQQWDSALEGFMNTEIREHAYYLLEQLKGRSIRGLTEPARASLLGWANHRMASMHDLPTADHIAVAHETPPHLERYRTLFQQEFKFGEPQAPLRGRDVGQTSAAIAPTADFMLESLSPFLRQGAPAMHKHQVESLSLWGGVLNQESEAYGRVVREWAFDGVLRRYLTREFKMGPDGKPLPEGEVLRLVSEEMFSTSRGKKLERKQQDFLNLMHSAALAMMEYDPGAEVKGRWDQARDKASVFLGYGMLADAKQLKELVPDVIADKLVASLAEAKIAAAAVVAESGGVVDIDQALALEVEKRGIGLYRELRVPRTSKQYKPDRVWMPKDGLNRDMNYRATQPIWTVPAAWLALEFEGSELRQELIDSGRDASRLNLETLAQGAQTRLESLLQKANTSLPLAMSLEGRQIWRLDRYAPHYTGTGFLGREGRNLVTALEIKIKQAETETYKRYLDIVKHAYDHTTKRARPIGEASENMLKFAFDLKGVPFEGRGEALADIMSDRYDFAGLHKQMTYPDLVYEIHVELKNKLTERMIDQKQKLEAELDGVKDPLALAKALQEFQGSLTKREFSKRTLKRFHKTYAELYKKTGLKPDNMLGAADAVHRYAGDLISTLQTQSVLNQFAIMQDGAGTQMMIPIPNTTYEGPEMFGNLTWRRVAQNLSNQYNEALDPKLSAKQNVANIVDKHIRKPGSPYTRVESPYESITEFYTYKSDAENVMDAWLAGGEVAGMLSHALQNPWEDSYGIVNRLERLNTWAKLMSVQLSLFFPIAGLESLTALSGGKFWLEGGPATLVEFNKMLKADHPYVRNITRLMDKLGIERAHIANPMGLPRGIVAKDVQKLTDFAEANFNPKVAEFTKTLAGLPLKQSELVFEGFFNSAKVWATHFWYQKLQAQADAKGIAFDAEAALRPYAMMINNELGGWKWENYTWATPTWRRWFQLAMFSPMWTASAANAAGFGVLTGPVLKNWMTPEAAKHTMFRRWPTMAAFVMFAVPAAMQGAAYLTAAATGTLEEDDEFFMGNNETGKKLHADITPLTRQFPWYEGFPTGERRQYIRWGKQGFETWRWLESPWQALLGKTSNITRWALEQSTGYAAGSSEWPMDFRDMGLMGLVVDRRGEFMGSRLGHTIQKFMPFSLLGWAQNQDAAPFQLVGPTSRGMSFHRATKAYMGLLDTWARPDTYAKIYKNPRIKANLEALGPEILDAARRNGYDPDKVITSAKGAVLKDLYAKMYRALDKNDMKELERTARSIARLNGTVSSVRRSVRNRNNMYGKAESLSQEQREMITEAFSRP